MSGVGASGWALDEIPVVQGMIGAAAIPVLSGYLSQQHDTYAHIGAAAALYKIAVRHPETRDSVVRVLVQALARR